jgi:hypothetical protein
MFAGADGIKRSLQSQLCFSQLTVDSLAFLAVLFRDGTNLLTLFRAQLKAANRVV